MNKNVIQILFSVDDYYCWLYMGVQLHSTIQKQLSNNNCTIPRILDGHVVEMKRCDWPFTIGCIIISFIGDCFTVKSIYNQKNSIILLLQISNYHDGKLYCTNIDNKTCVTHDSVIEFLNAWWEDIEKPGTNQY